MIYLFFLGNDFFNHASAIPKRPPTQTTTPWTHVVALNDLNVKSGRGNEARPESVKSARALPTSISNVINNFETAPYLPKSFVPHAPPPPPLPPSTEMSMLPYYGHKEFYISYTNTKWKLHLRKEV